MLCDCDDIRVYYKYRNLLGPYLICFKNENFQINKIHNLFLEDIQYKYPDVPLIRFEYITFPILVELNHTIQFNDIVYLDGKNGTIIHPQPSFDEIKNLFEDVRRIRADRVVKGNPGRTIYKNELYKIPWILGKYTCDKKTHFYTTFTKGNNAHSLPYVECKKIEKYKEPNGKIKIMPKSIKNKIDNCDQTISNTESRLYSKNFVRKLCKLSKSYKLKDKKSSLQISSKHILPENETQKLESMTNTYKVTQYVHQPILVTYGQPPFLHINSLNIPNTNQSSKNSKFLSTNQTQNSNKISAENSNNDFCNQINSNKNSEITSQRSQSRRTLLFKSKYSKIKVLEDSNDQKISLKLNKFEKN